VLVVVTVVMAFGIGARLGVEGCVDLRDVAAKLFSQVGEHVIGANTQPSVEYLHWHVPVTEMPSNPHQAGGGMRVDLEQRLRRGAYHHNATPFQRQPVSVAQASRLRQIEQQLGTRLSVQRDAAPVSVVMVKEHGVDSGRGVPTGSR